jgi:Protein of unknown function (DUF4058)
MPSPFPCMNPYIEQDAFWHDFHLGFLLAMRARLVALVRPKYIFIYTGRPDPPLASKDAAWAQTFVPKKR